MSKASALIEQAKHWVGYLEKKSNAQLDDFTANAGKNNYTRFNRDYSEYTGQKLQPAQWCGTFVSCCFVYEFGLEKAKQLLCGGLHSYTPSGARYFKNKGRYIKRGEGTPKAGDVVFFYSSSKGRIGHVGIVTKVTSSKIYTVEGNTSGASTLVTNGGGVREKSYYLTSTYIDGYGSVAYDEKDDTGESGSSSTSGISISTSTLKKGSKGEQVKTIQRLLIALGYSLDKYGADGDFGSETTEAVKEYQGNADLEKDGIVGDKTWESIVKNGVEKKEEKDDGIVLNVDMLKSRSKGEQVKTVQRLLMALGYKLPKYGADGDFGSETVSAVKAYQKDKGLSSDGIVGEDTWNKLIKG